jgi:hypothetical protein
MLREQGAVPSNTTAVAANSGGTFERPVYNSDSTPSSAASSRRSSFSSQQANYPSDVMTRSFPKPLAEPSLEDMLNRPALRHSLRHYVESSREPRPRAEPDVAAKKEALRKAKEDLLRGWKV